jgi:glycerol uptake facilitator-like aquaporin
MTNSEIKKYIAEAVGTMALTLVVILSLAGKFPVSTPVLAGAVLALFVYSIGHISGSHINPAVTIGAWSIKKISNKDAIAYIISQFFGATIALIIATACKIEFAKMDLSNTSLLVAFAELLGTALFTFGIASVIYGRTPKDISGVVIGASLFTGIAISVLLGASGILNPAVAFGIKSFGVMYVLGPVIGSILGMQAYKYLSE